MENLLRVFHIAHIVIVMHMRSLSESRSFLGFPLLFSWVKEPTPLISPMDILGHLLVLHIFQILFAVSQAMLCPLCSHSNQRCCSVSRVTLPSASLQATQ